MFGRQLFENAKLCIYFYSLWTSYLGGHPTLHTRKRGRENASLKMWKPGHARPEENLGTGRSTQWLGTADCSHSSSSCGPGWCSWVRMKEKQKKGGGERLRVPYSLDPIIHSHIYIFCLPKTAIAYQIGKEPGIIRQKENLIWASKDFPWVLCRKEDTQELHSPNTVRGT